MLFYSAICLLNRNSAFRIISTPHTPTKNNQKQPKQPWKSGQKEPCIPLLLNKQRNLFKLFQNDVGLLAYQYANGIQFRILSGDVNINYGAIYENAVAQELYAQGFERLYYFNSKKQGEVDFVIEIGDGTVLPIEVKSGKDYEYHHALANILDNVEYNLNKAIILCNDNVSIDGKKTYLPIYMATFIRKKQEIPGYYQLDLI